MASGHELAMRLRVAYLALHRKTNAAVARSGLTADQFVLLTALAEGDGVTQKGLANRIGSDPNTMSEMLARLESKGLVERARHAADGRARCVTLTSRGRQVQASLWEASAPLREGLETLFPTEGLESLVRGLERVALAMGAPQELDPRPGASSHRAGES